MKQYQRDRLENKYCYGSHSWQAQIIVKLHGEDARGCGWNKIVNYRIAKRIGRLSRQGKLKPGLI